MVQQFFKDWTTKDYVTAAIAVYGAVLATYTAVSKWRENRVNVKVTLSMMTEPLFARDALGGQTNRVVDGRVQAYLNIVIRNHGYRNVSLPKDCCVLEPRKQERIRLRGIPGLPTALAHGESFRLVAHPENALAGAKGIRAIVSDELSRKYYSRWVKFDPTETAALLRRMK